MRLIDADKLPLDIMPEDVDNAPTIDAVPVVRCRECKYQDECIRRIEFIGRNPVLEQNTYEYHPLSFCSYGQRKEAANET
jgi:hypothetical protein|nr:MAG TPA: hypothetical protein [Caudoviricetes sp.]